MIRVLRFIQYEQHVNQCNHERSSVRPFIIFGGYLFGGFCVLSIGVMNQRNNL